MLSFLADSIVVPILRRIAAPCKGIIGAACLLAASPTFAQRPGVQYPFDGATPPGAIGAVRLQRGGPVESYFQPVEFRGPEGLEISLAVEGEFADSEPAPLNVGLLISRVYRLRVSNIPGQDGAEVYPTVEIIDRMYPPAGMERRFPIPVEITRADLDLALEGKFVTRVVYLEDPDTALPIAETENQNWFDAGPGSNPLLEADRLGRPMAILRMGGRLPDAEFGDDDDFLNGSPPFSRFVPFTATADESEIAVEDGEMAEGDVGGAAEGDVGSESGGNSLPDEDSPPAITERDDIETSDDAPEAMDSELGDTSETNEGDAPEEGPSESDEQPPVETDESFESDEGV